MEQTSDNFSGTAPETPNTLSLNAEIKNYLSETAKWGKFLGILGFIIVGLMVVFSLFMGLFMNRLPVNPMQNQSPMGNFGGLFMAVYLLLIALLYFFPSFYLYKFATKTRSALVNNDSVDFAEAFSKLKSFFKFWGIFTIIALTFYIVALIGIGIFGILMQQNGTGV